MSNQEKVYDLKRMHNQKAKEEFLQTQLMEDNTRKTYSYVFYKSKSTEQKLGYDLADFNREEVGSLLKRFNSMTYDSMRSYARMIEKYITWSIRSGLRSNNIHPLKDAGEDYYEQYYVEKKLFISEDELIDIEDELVNYQDKAVLRCIFEGISGHDLSELSNLHKDDIKWSEKKIHLKDNRYKNRTIEVSDRLLNIIKVALEKTEYQKANGKSLAKSPIMQLIPSNYVFKNANTHTTRIEQSVDKHTFYRKLTVISNLFDLPYLTAKNIQKSGMIKMAVDIYKDKKGTGDLANEELDKIAKQFGIRKVSMGEQERYNYFIMRQTINAKNIKDLYDINISK